MRRHHIVGSPCRMQCHAACVLQAWFTLSENIVGRQLVPSRPPGRPSGTWRCLALHLGSSAVHTALSGQLRPPKSRRRGLLF